MASFNFGCPNKNGKSSQSIMSSFYFGSPCPRTAIRSSFEDQGSSMMLLPRLSHGLPYFALPLLHFQRIFFDSPTRSPTGALDESCCTQGTTTSLRNPPTRRRLDAVGDVPNTTGTKKQQRKAINTVFNEVHQRAYVLGARKRERFY